jgi:hypothetical protein
MRSQKSKAELHHINQAACCIEVVPSLKKYKLPSNTAQIRFVSNLIEQKSITDPLAHYFAGMPINKKFDHMLHTFQQFFTIRQQHFL